MKARLLAILAATALLAACTGRTLSGPAVIETIFDVADSLGMDLLLETCTTGGGQYEAGLDLDSLMERQRGFMERLYARYGTHPSFAGWYFGNEINPVDATDTLKSRYWRTFWRSGVETARRLDPACKVTISPFFILDKDEWRGFPYREPEEYRAWWGETLRQSGIDRLMIQDSGAEHQAFFTIEERRPFIEAFALACADAGAEFWVNVETGQVHARDWPDALAMERERRRAWEFTPPEVLAAKLALAAEYATGTINWGYFPLMTPTDGPAVSQREIDGQAAIDLSARKDSYQAYLDYLGGVPAEPGPGQKTRPVLGGTFWWLVPGIDTYPRAEAVSALRREMVAMHRAGLQTIVVGTLPLYFDKECLTR